MEIKKNQYYIVRCDRSGVFFGKITERNGQEVTMSDVRNIYYWDGAATIRQLAAEGTTKPKECKFTMAVDEILLLDAIEIISCTETAVSSIKGVKEWKM
ncbi:hypothetical protein [Massilibacteroides sp.]|uniref:DUF6948 domain-containing protein n=1 Tax=Massilibacteroides sp. TaxID=2034766 RepID=UPI0026141AB1|nr:hypothetical protein [Massilibacteroides sp.]MDD4516585.1 hypothetical protein [Massilibacteroides sp.]